MWKQKIGLSLGRSYPIPIEEAIALIKASGFDAVSPHWTDDGSLPATVEAARRCGLEIQSLHGPYHKAAALWSPDPAVSQPAVEEMLQALEDCRSLQIPIMVVHVWIGFDYAFSPDLLYYENFDLLVSRAAACGVQLAFENTEGEEYLFALMEHLEGNPAVGFCWDSGHELCYNRSRDLLADFGDRLIMTHLNDNLGVSRFDGRIFWTDDLHLLPYDGISDWDDNIARLRRAKPMEILNFELNIASKPNRHENDKYGRMPLETYFAEAYARACRIAWRYARHTSCTLPRNHT